MPGYPKEQLQDLYKSLPKDLQRALYSEENARNNYDICTKNGVTDEDAIFEVAKNTGYVLLGLLPPNELQEVLEKELKLEENKAEQIASEIARFILLPVKNSLETLYKIEIKPGIKPKVAPLPEGTPPPAEKKPKKRDIYREPIE